MPLECRDFLRIALAEGDLLAEDAHGRACAHCSRRVALHRRLASWIKVRPTPPAALLAPSLLSAIHERVIDASEANALGNIVRNLPGADLARGGIAGSRIAATAAASWPEGLLDSPLAREVVATPAPRSAAVWARVRRTILAEVRASPVRRWRMRLWLGAGGVAATLIVSALLLREVPPSPTTIVFTDFEGPPEVEYTVLRRGAR